MNPVLVVEDQPDVRAWLVDTARAAFADAQVLAFGRCQEALAHVAQGDCALAMIDLGLPDGHGTHVLHALRQHQPQAVGVVVTVHDGDEHLFPALQAGALGYVLKDTPRPQMVQHLQRLAQREPSLSPSIARSVLGHFSAQDGSGCPLMAPRDPNEVSLNARETDILQRVAKGYTLPEIAVQLGLSRHTVADYVKQIYRKLGVSSRAEAALEAARRGLVRP
jgi:DNA-binding NarL/FixJ family response regulator